FPFLWTLCNGALIGGWLSSLVLVDLRVKRYRAASGQSGFVYLLVDPIWQLVRHRESFLGDLLQAAYRLRRSRRLVQRLPDQPLELRQPVGDAPPRQWHPFAR